MSQNEAALVDAEEADELPKQEIVDPDRDLEVPETWSDYIAFMKKEIATVRWMITEFTTPTSQWWTKAMILCTCLVHATGLSFSYITGLALASAGSHNGSGVDFAVKAYLLLGVVQTFLWYGYGASIEHVLGKTFVRVDARISELFFQKSLGQHERHGSRLNHATIDKGRWKVLELWVMLCFQGIPTLLVVALAYIGILCFSFQAGAMATIVALSYGAWALYLNRETGKEMNPIEREFRAINRARVEAWEKCHRVMNAGTAERDNALLDWRMSLNMSKDLMLWTWFNKHTSFRMLALQRTFQAGVLWWGGHQVTTGNLDMAILVSLIAWSELFAGNLWVLSNIERNLVRNIIPVMLMQEVLEIPAEFDRNTGKEFIPNGPIEIEFRNVSYSYKDERGVSYPALRNVSFKIHRGEMMAIIGLSGAGKTTVMKALLRYSDLDEGVILINGVPLNEWNLDSLLRHIGCIAQSPELFDATLEENLIHGATLERREALLAHDSQKLWELVRLLAIDFGKRLTKGLKTPVGNHGLKLSGGQKQRTLIGAAMAKDPVGLAIDEATSSLDSATIKQVVAGLEELSKGGRTGVVVTHQLATVQNLCNKFLVLKSVTDLAPGENQVEAIAPSLEELWKVSPIFRSLAKEQGLVI